MSSRLDELQNLGYGCLMIDRIVHQREILGNCLMDVKFYCFKIQGMSGLDVGVYFGLVCD